MLASAFGVLASGCANKDDIVATQSSVGIGSEGGLRSSPRPPQCQAGVYKGGLSATHSALSPGDAGLDINYMGTIAFVITESLSGEFTVPDDTAQLSGNGDASSFQATIHGGRCDEGQVQATLENGSYTFFTDAAKTMSTTYTFQGSITGSYGETGDRDAQDDLSGFFGRWNTALQTPYGRLIVVGEWSAARTE